MRTDITRNTFDAAKNFSRVLMQQGRVQLDSDWNEQTSILLHYLRALAVDVIGQSTGPNAACGFELIVNQQRLNDLFHGSVPPTVQQIFNGQHVLITPGRYYVDGWLVENAEFVSFFHQPHFRRQGDVSELRQSMPANGRSLVYLDVWERPVTFVDDDSIREKALGGPDTAMRAQVVWRVRNRDLTEMEDAPPSQSRCVAIKAGWEKWKHDQRANRGKLRAKVREEEESDDPCVASAESAYRGVENQLYRIEIHHAGVASDAKSESIFSNVATFKWSRDNGSVFAAWLNQEGEALTMGGLHDRARGFASGQWIELSDDEREIRGKPGRLVKVNKLDGDIVTIEQGSDPVDRKQFSNTAVARRWDQHETEETKLHKGAIPVVEGQWFTLEDGVQVYFEPAAASGPVNRYRTGDYWLIPARVETKNIEWPQELDDEGKPRKDAQGSMIPAAVTPRGVTHHYAPLGLLSLDSDAFRFEDCRCRFDPLHCAYGYSFGGEGIGADLL